MAPKFLRVYAPMILLACSTAAAQAAEVMTVDNVLDLALKKSETLRGIEQSTQALEADIASRDLLLATTFTSELAMFNDNRQTVAGTNTSRRGNSGLLDLGLTKPFSTGTKLAVTASHQLLTSESFQSDRNVAEWEVRLSQSLWRDAFGRNTRLRRESEQEELKSGRLENLLSRQQFLIEVENAYWDLVLAQKEVAIREGNVERSTALEKWVRTRINRFAAEATDLLQVQALSGSRQLDLIDAKNRLENARARLRELIPDVTPETWQLDVASLEAPRDPRALMIGQGAPSAVPQRLDALASARRTEQAKKQAARVDDTLKPSLDAYVAYGANGIESSTGSAWDRAGRAEQNAGRVGLLLSVELDSGLKDEKRRAASLTAAAQESRTQALSRESTIAWTELQRNIGNLKTQAKEARDLAQVQLRKVTAERRRYEQGRTTALQLTTFEVDAAESELRLNRLLTNLRKAESGARTFTLDESGGK